MAATTARTYNPNLSARDASVNLHVWRFGLATTVAISAVYVLCALAIALFPQGTFALLNNWFHGLDLTLLKPPGGRPITAVQLMVGWVTLAAVTFPAGSLLAVTYNYFGRRTKASVASRNQSDV